eukprot:TRINITY_DN660_c0_g1_i1.p1 TRINITY_DN660_c0_g1~~TRINITY_DN660_c0_g1_i1.p1  ORF type:complete len:423 (+),score=64.62 TRINITY_DN660_c0_g1_i1:224-1492(+)
MDVHICAANFLLRPPLHSQTADDGHRFSLSCKCSFHAQTYRNSIKSRTKLRSIFLKEERVITHHLFSIKRGKFCGERKSFATLAVQMKHGETSRKEQTRHDSESPLQTRSGSSRNDENTINNHQETLPQAIAHFVNSLGDEPGDENPVSFSVQSETKTNGGNEAGEEEDAEGEGMGKMAAEGSLALVGSLVLFLAAIGVGAYLFKDQIGQGLDYFSEFIEETGPLGYVLFVLGYGGLEVLAIPAIPLTMSAGLLFGPVLGTALVSLSGTVAATISFLIARYVARDRIQQMVKGNRKFVAIDRAIGEDSFRVVMFLRLSPLLPFALSNYIYGLTSVRLMPYILGSWLGMLPGTWAYVSAGAFGRLLLRSEVGASSLLSSGSSLWGLVATIGTTAAAATYVTNIAQKAVEGLEEKDDSNDKSEI